MLSTLGGRESEREGELKARREEESN